MLFALLTGSAFGQGTVTGTATYRERMVLPPESVLEVILLDVSRADAKAETVGRTTMEQPGSPPFKFSIHYDPARIDPRHRYAVRATIRARGRLLFTTDTHYPVLTHGGTDSVELLLRRVGGAAAASEVFPARLGSIPATFKGVLPCADCPGIDYHLNLFGDRAYYLRTLYQDKPDGTFYDIGSWLWSSDGRTLVLRGGREAHLYFEIKDADTLVKLDIKGQPIVSAANHELRRAAELEPIEPRLFLRGMFRYFADAPQFEECLTRRKLPVRMEEDYLALERTYTAVRRTPGEPILATLDGQIAERAGMEGPPRPSLLVERFASLWPGETCRARFATERLENTYWKLVRLRNEPIVIAPDQREPHIVPHAEDRRVAGSGGCNRLLGGYRLDDERIAFEGLASTMMACVAGMEQEQAFLDALRDATRWRVLGSHLELFGSDGALLARLEARHMK